jgi:probable HAF family extracellular repeat protein
MAEAAIVRSSVPELLPGVYPSRVNDINENGVSVGYVNNTWWFKKAVMWTADGEMVELGFLPGMNMSVAEGINNRGDIVGYCGQYIALQGGPDRIVDMNYRATLWTAEGEIIDLGSLPSAESMALAINNHREIVGRTYLRWIESSGDTEFSVRQSYHAFLWTPKEGIKDLGAFPGGDTSVAFDINDRGQIVGYASNGTGSERAFIAAMWTRDGDVTNLGILPGGRFSLAYGINERGQVVGYSSTGDLSPSLAFMWTTKGGMQTLQTPQGGVSYAHSINNNGQIVGYSILSGWRTALLWTAKGEVIELLPAEGHDSSQAFGINNRGQIVGISYTRSIDLYEIGDAVIWSTRGKP